jgi:hypothetical protein
LRPEPTWWLGLTRCPYGDLATLGIAKGRPFAPDERMTAILERAAVNANGQLRVQAFADRGPDRIVWPDRHWEWAALRFESGDFDGLGYLDEYAREKWFFQAIAASPAMFRRAPGAGSLYWLGLRDKTGAYLDGLDARRRRLGPRPRLDRQAHDRSDGFRLVVSPHVSRQGPGDC